MGKVSLAKFTYTSVFIRQHQVRLSRPNIVNTIEHSRFHEVITQLNTEMKFENKHWTVYSEKETRDPHSWRLKNVVIKQTIIKKGIFILCQESHLYSVESRIGTDGFK